MQIFLDTGLYHLLIVSGSHLIFIAGILARLNLKSRRWHWIGLLTYACMCLLSPPISRSFLQLTLSELSARRNLFWTQEQVVFYTGIACLLLFPDWFFSFSFVLSWTASLTLCFTRRLFVQHCLIFCFMWPLLRNTSPWSILSNFLISPLFSLGLFPASVLTFLIPGLNSITEPLWQCFLFLLDLGPRLSNSASISPPTITAMWTYIAALHILLQLLPLWKETPEKRLNELGKLP
ncbi:MAG: ComEC/Rec2 family competence protein [Bdellovibrionales bacterium]|nr:ComEC/Rec2 family competence protein [Bdellovibrionales bacterium]